MRFTKFLVLLSSILVVSCSTKSFLVSSGYEGKIIADKVMLIPNLGNCKVWDKNSFFNAEELNVLENNFVIQFNNGFGTALQPKSTLRQIYSIKIKNDPAKEKRMLHINEKESITLQLPQKPIKIDSTEDTYILHIENFEVTIFQEALDTSDPAKHYNVSVPAPGIATVSPSKFMDQFFTVTFNYAIYENNSMELVCYGKMNVKDQLKNGVDFEKTFSGTLDKIATKILKDTPFQK